MTFAEVSIEDGRKTKKLQNTFFNIKQCTAKMQYGTHVVQMRVKTSYFFFSNKVDSNHFFPPLYFLRMSELNGQNKGAVCIFLFINVVSHSLYNMNSLCSAPTSVTIFSPTPQQGHGDKAALCIHVLSFVFYGFLGNEDPCTRTRTCTRKRRSLRRLAVNILSKRGFIRALCNTL